MNIITFPPRVEEIDYIRDSEPELEDVSRLFISLTGFTLIPVVKLVAQLVRRMHW